jgi:hypothetical protein
MAYTYRSASFAGKTNSLVDYVDITKPVGLTVGDLMISVAGTSAAASSIITPDGWTTCTVTDGTYFFVSYKIADSTDVAASNFRFYQNSTGDFGIGILVFYTPNAGQVFYSAKEVTGNNSTTPSYVNSISNVYGESIIIAAIINQDSDENPGLTSLAIATENPTWYDGVISRDLFIKYALRNATELSTGNLSAVLTNTPSVTRGLLASFPTYKENIVSETATLTELSTTKTSSDIIETITLVESKDLEKNITFNQSKNSESFTNQTKNSASVTNTTKNNATVTNQTES